MTFADQAIDRAIERMADALTSAGHLTDQEWRRVMHAVPRHLFIPERGYAVLSSPLDGPGPGPIDHAADPERWWSVVYAGHMGVVTQRDDGEGDPASPEGSATSANSAPDVVFPFLQLLGPAKGERILDVGTGTGWTTALLAERVGPDNVTSVEVDPEVAAVAAGNIHRAGYSPTLVVGDGAAGWPRHAPYDGIHVTAGVREVPYEWIRQLTPDGRVVLPWMTDVSGFKVLLRPEGDRAVGTFHGSCTYMPLRSQRLSGAWAKHHTADARTTRTRLDPADVMDAAPGADLFLAMHVPRIVMLRYRDQDGTRSCFLAEAGDPRGSWATCDSGPGGEHTVTQYGDRRLWDEVETSHLRWIARGRPGTDLFRLLVDPDGQRLHLGE